MKTRFKLTSSGSKCATRLEEHLVGVARRWCQGLNRIPLDTLDHFYNALQREKGLYCEDHRSARVTSVRIIKTGDSISIGPADPAAGASASIRVMTATETDQADIQESLLIPNR